MFKKLKGFFFKLFNIDNKWQRGLQVPGEAFPFHKGVVLRAVDEVVIGLPDKLLSDNEPIEKALICDNDARVQHSEDDNLFYVWLMPGMKISLSKSCEAIVIADDNKPRSFDIYVPKELR